jgi:UDP-N-acetylmuramate dehydrogenase
MNQESIKNQLPLIKENVCLADHTTFMIGGAARYFFVAKTNDDLIKAVNSAKAADIPWFVLGGGSNLLVADEGYNGLVIKVQSSKFKVQDSDLELKIIEAEAGVLLGKIVDLTAENGLRGLEWAAGIPGTVGGAVRGNAAAFSGSMGDATLKRVEVFDSDRGEIFWLNNQDCYFGYRTSIFKQNPQLVILAAEFELEEGDSSQIQNKVKQYLEYRREHHPLSFPSAGSIFQNQKSKIKNQKLLEEFPLFKEFNKKNDIPAALLIDKCGLKAVRVGRAQISEKHANFIINLGGAKAKDVLALIALAKEKVKTKFGIALEEEIFFLE